MVLFVELAPELPDFEPELLEAEPPLLPDEPKPAEPEPDEPELPPELELPFEALCPSDAPAGLVPTLAPET